MNKMMSEEGYWSSCTFFLVIEHIMYYVEEMKVKK